MIELSCLFVLLIAKFIPNTLYSSIFAKGEFLSVTLSIVIVLYVYLHYFFRLYNDYYNGGEFKKAIKINFSYLFLCITILLGIQYYLSTDNFEMLVIRLIMYTILFILLYSIYNNSIKKEYQIYSKSYIIIKIIKTIILFFLVYIARQSTISNIFKNIDYSLLFFTLLTILEFYIQIKKEYWLHVYNFNMIVELIARTNNLSVNYFIENFNDKRLNLEINFLLRLSFIRLFEVYKLEYRLKKHITKIYGEDNNINETIKLFRKYIFSNYMRRHSDKWIIPSNFLAILQNTKKNGRRCFLI